MKVEYITPFVRATAKVFRTMLDCDLEAKCVQYKRHRQPLQEISGIVSMSGHIEGLAVLGISRATAIRATRALLGDEVTSVNEMVRDAVGELTNIIAGNAKADLERFQLRLGLPTVIIGKNHLLPLPPRCSVVAIVFASDWDEIAVEVSMWSPL